MKRVILACIFLGGMSAAWPSCDLDFLTNTNTNNNGTGNGTSNATPTPAPTPACSGRTCVTSADCCVAPAGSPEQCIVTAGIGVCL